ncbi:MAG: glycosyltransferase family 2 protein [Methanomassiliicoccales archaeon]
MNGLHPLSFGTLTSPEKSGDKDESPIFVQVIVPTICRPVLLDRALKSIVEQSLQGFELTIVLDRRDRRLQETMSTIGRYRDILKMRVVFNQRTPNLSGAINTALDEIEKYCGIDIDPYIAILDDDDWWDSDYLAYNTERGVDQDADWVVSGIIRHDEGHPAGYLLTIPEKFVLHDILVSNPNIQGSNLFVRLSKLLEVGGFDEDLSSTTDRDICIRLLGQDGIRCVTTDKHLVHHDALPRNDRLSTPGSETKRQGLNSFYRKYRHLMSEEDALSFKERARGLFAIDIE